MGVIMYILAIIMLNDDIDCKKIGGLHMNSIFKQNMLEYD